jgi:glucan biosynthesis protein C
MGMPITHASKHMLPRAAPPHQVYGGRRVELDWLRTIVVLATIPFHAIPIFGVERTIFMLSAESNPVLRFVGGFVLTWGIPLIFLMAGASTKCALDRRSPGRYVKERFTRLAAPLLLMVFVFAPLQLYFILLNNPDLLQNPRLIPQYGALATFPEPDRLSDIVYFFQQYLHYLVTSVRQYSPAVGSVVLGHLWFVPRLLAVSLVCLPLALYLRGRGLRVAKYIAAYGAHPLVLLAGGGLIPAILAAILQSGWLTHTTAGWLFSDDWPSFFLDLVMFLYGYLIYSSARLRATVQTMAIPALILGIVCSIVVGIVIALGRAPVHNYSPASLLFVFAETLMAWLPALALLGLAIRYLDVPSHLQRYLTDAAFPVFVLHGPLLAISTYYLLQTPLPSFVQVVLIITVTVISAFAIYEFVVRRTPVTRFLFGAKAPKAESHPPLR